MISWKMNDCLTRKSTQNFDLSENKIMMKLKKAGHQPQDNKKLWPP
jgi:hypothetical protein